MCLPPFHHNEEAYEAWLRAHPDGWVFNHFRGNNPTYNKLHHLPCHYINKPSQRGHWTEYAKICCTDRDCITETVRGLREDSWEFCGCMDRR
jgi:hypothetical protein